MGWWVAFLYLMVFLIAAKVDKLEDRSRRMNERLDILEREHDSRHRQTEWDKY
ncbi:MAG: hypothetical protein OYK82_09155 [Gammaproteobacteria bacterium]|nr:hypothetical protein [Gammaproteobacteria bacterium]